MNTSDQNNIESQLAAYALGALDLDEMPDLERVLAESPEHRDELVRLRTVVAHLPYAATSVDPPAHIREQLLARVAADQQTRVKPVIAAPSPAARPLPRRTSSWLITTTMAILAVLVLGLGGLTLTLQQTVANMAATNSALITTVDQLQGVLAETQLRQAQLADDLRAGQMQIDQLNDRLAQDQTLIAYVTAPGVATRELQAADAAEMARGEMYMYPGNSDAVVLFSGLETLEAGKVYQFWLADGATQVAGGTFSVNASGIATLVIDAPREVNAYRQVMVTVEPAGGSTSPSNQVVLSGSL
ncbi:MAG: anti-sigma factor [Oscillochloris sp.]|nr:anti-sigma factor [Oscillochloris sp.]